MVVLVVDVLVGESILDKLKVTLEQFTLACADSVLGFELVSLSGVSPCVSDELADALLAVLLTDTLLAVLVGLALLVAAGQTLLAPVLAGNGLEVVVSTLTRVLVTAD